MDGRTAGRPDGRTDGYVKIMPLVAPTPQLKLRWTDLSWSVGAECGNIVWYVKSTFLCPKDPLTRLVHENVRKESHTSMNSRAEWNGYKVVWINKRR